MAALTSTIQMLTGVPACQASTRFPTDPSRLQVQIPPVLHVPVLIKSANELDQHNCTELWERQRPHLTCDPRLTCDPCLAPSHTQTALAPCHHTAASARAL